MIHTSQDAVTALYDRKSPRHGWCLYCASNDAEYLARLVRMAKAKLATKPGWEQYQMKLVVFDCTESGTYPDSLPVGDRQGEMV